MFEQEFDDSDPLFCLAFHPEAPEFALGFASGRVSCFEYSSGKPVQKWTTKRHKSSCRCIGYSEDGKHLVSAGSDDVVKKCTSGDGKVTAKAKIEAPATAMAITSAFVVVGDELGGVTAFKLDNLKQVAEYGNLEDAENITAISPLPTERGTDFAVAGDTRLIHINLKKPEPVAISEDQEDELLCGCVVSEHWSAYGMSEGVVTVWKNKYFVDQQSRVRIVKDGSVDCILAGENDDEIIAGTSEGRVARADLRSGRVLWRGTHSDTEEVSMLDWDCEYHLVTGSMGLLKVWPKDLTEKSKAEHSDSKDGSDSSDSDTNGSNSSDSDANGSDDESDDGSDDVDESDANDSNSGNDSNDSSSESENEGAPAKKRKT